MREMPAFDWSAFAWDAVDFLRTHDLAFALLLLTAAAVVAALLVRVFELRWARAQQAIADDRRRQQDADDRARMETVVRLSDHRRSGGHEAA